MRQQGLRSTRAVPATVAAAGGSTGVEVAATVAAGSTVAAAGGSTVAAGHPTAAADCAGAHYHRWGSWGSPADSRQPDTGQQVGVVAWPSPGPRR